MPLRKRYLFVCTNLRPEGNPKGSCGQQGSEALLVAFKKGLIARGLANTEARACGSTCLDVCHQAAVVAVQPDGYFLGHVTEADVPEILDGLATGQIVQRLVIAADGFNSAEDDRISKLIPATDITKRRL